MPTSVKIFTANDIESFNYKNCGDRTRNEFENWVRSMTNELDRETGDGPEGALAWVKMHNATFNHDDIYQTCILCYKPTGAVVATISIVRDDRDVAKTYNIEGDGFWGLANVRRDLRGRSLGKIVFDHCDTVCQSHANKHNKQLTFNGFTGNPLSAKLLTNQGFAFNRQIIRPDINATRDLYSKTYHPINNQ
jgi:hypothetical protein